MLRLCMGKDARAREEDDQTMKQTSRSYISIFSPHTKLLAPFKERTFLKIQFSHPNVTYPQITELYSSLASVTKKTVYPVKLCLNLNGV